MISVNISKEIKNAICLQNGFKTRVVTRLITAPAKTKTGPVYLHSTFKQQGSCFTLNTTDMKTKIYKEQSEIRIWDKYEQK